MASQLGRGWGSQGEASPGQSSAASASAHRLTGRPGSGQPVARAGPPQAEIIALRPPWQPPPPAELTARPLGDIVVSRAPPPGSMSCLLACPARARGGRAQGAPHNGDSVHSEVAAGTRLALSLGPSFPPFSGAGTSGGRPRIRTTMSSPCLRGRVLEARAPGLRGPMVWGGLRGTWDTS